MKLTETGFPGLLLLEPHIFNDQRGYFFESYNKEKFAILGLEYDFIQDNQAASNYGVVRGLHFQKPPFAQTKLVRSLYGSILDVVVDCRVGSPTFGKVFSVELSAENKKQLLVPKGFAHGYSVLSNNAEVFYKCDAFYNKSAEGGVLFKDSNLAIDWRIPKADQIISEKDLCYPVFEKVEHLFRFER